MIALLFFFSILLVVFGPFIAYPLDKKWPGHGRDIVLTAIGISGMTAIILLWT